jgi:hypothetical protein
MPPGVYGDKLLVTSLFNRTQPLIRYELSDSVRLSPVSCPCGRPFALIDDIQGRMEEVLSPAKCEWQSAPDQVQPVPHGDTTIGERYYGRGATVEISS